uniref:F-box/LRR-repeat protein 7-like n=1 Tax=Saccoglossus kowalevskii TaxID=10224 RepID=A0ABM0MKU0_SACKO|nr:PREDICTED: F-box/LRR-repeat protein 7-like [Saccoglossus kowalevskii]
MQDDNYGNIFDLPEEVLLHIINFISPISEDFINLKLTSRLFHRLTEDNTLYILRCLRLKPTSHVPGIVLQRVLTSSYMLNYVDFTDCDYVTDAFIGHLLSTCPTVMALYLAGCVRLSNESVRTITDMPFKVKELDLSRCPLITCTSMIQFAKRHGDTLRLLALGQCFGLRKDPYKFGHIAHYVPNLERIYLGWKPENHRLNPLLDMDLQRFLNSCQNLKYIDVSNSQISSYSMQVLANRCHEVRHLNVSRCYVQDNGIESLAKGLPRLTFLDISDCIYITDISLEHLSNGCPQLQHLNVSRCYDVTDSGLLSLQARCHKLRSLSLRHCFNVTDRGVERITTCCADLEFLDIADSVAITNETVERIVMCGNSTFGICVDRCPLITAPVRQRCDASPKQPRAEKCLTLFDILSPGETLV